MLYVKLNEVNLLNVVINCIPNIFLNKNVFELIGAKIINVVFSNGFWKTVAYTILIQL